MVCEGWCANRRLEKAPNPPYSVVTLAVVLWTQAVLAEHADMNELQIGHLERGANDPKWSTILKLARAFALKPEELIRGLR